MEDKNTMSQNSKTSKEEINYWDSILDEYENGISIPQYSPNSLPEDELNSYLSMNRNELEQLNPDSCAHISYRLAQYSFHIQRTLNREIARHNWVEETIKETIADEINNYKGYGYVEKYYQAVKHNERAKSLNSIKKYAKQRIDRLSYISNSLKNLSDIILNIQKIKVKYAN
jgi:hypothetical protein